MKTNVNRGHRAVLVATLALGALGLSVEACGGVGPDGEPGQPGTASAEKTGKTAQDLSILGINIDLPTPVVTVGLNDASVRIDPIGTIEELLPPVTLPDPLQPINTLIGDLEDGGAVGVEAPGLSVKLALPGLPLPQLPDPFDAGVPIFVP